MSSYYRSILNVQAVALDPDAEAFLTATGITDATITSAINTLVLDLKGYGIWTKMKAIYPIVGGTAATHKFNLKDPRDLDAAFRLEFFGGITHSVNGMQGNGTNGYAETHLRPDAFNRNSLGGFCGINQTGGTGVDFGALISGVNNGFHQNRFNASGNFATRHNCSNVTSGATSDTTGFFGINRTNSSNYQRNINGTKTIISEPSTSDINISMYLMAFNVSGIGALNFSSRRYPSFYFTDGLTDTEQDNLQAADLALQTTLGR
jgi:hypothetical protein